ncbi:Apoptosis inhibitor 5 [Mortierella alpina]|uniref:Apoptosis inhibitor 5 n=1 Tax=Mortierella alpina TaxID=64518 RepID=A0A9P6IZ01_MORAP|nr:Apoptosis inhibitor 5 [Mortierella alpina]
MADLDQIYNAYNEITDAKEKASEHTGAYKVIIAGSQGSDGAKRLTAQFIPAFFKHFPALHTKAIDGVFDLCEDDSSLIRQAAIKSLPMLCRDGPQHTIKIADVLCQLLQLDDQDLLVVQGALLALLTQSPREVLAVIFQQGVKGIDLREQCLDFISHHVMASKKELFKDPEIEVYFAGEIQNAMSLVSNGDLEILAKIIMQTRPYQTGALDLTGLLKTYVAHITAAGPFNVKNPESVKRVLVAGMLSMPLFKRTISADPLLEFIGIHILPRNAFNCLTEKHKTSVLRLYADSFTSGHASATIVKSAGQLLTDLVVAIVPAEQEATHLVELAQVECLTNLLYYIATKEPGVTDRHELMPRFRGLYMATQTNTSGLKQELASAVAKKPQDEHQAALIKRLGRALLMQNNIHAAVKEFMKPKHLRNTKTTIHPSWKAVPEPAQPDTPKVASVVSKPNTKGTPKKVANASNSNATNATNTTTKIPVKPSQTKAGVRSAPNQQQQQQQHQQQQQQQQQGGSNKRKAESESSTKPKKTKILRRQGSNAGGNSPGNTSPGGHGGHGGHGNKSPGGHGSKGSKQNQAHQQTQHAPLVSQSAQAAQQAKKNTGGPGRGHNSLPSSFDNKRARDGNGRISFLKR